MIYFLYVLLYLESWRACLIQSIDTSQSMIAAFVSRGASVTCRCMNVRRPCIISRSTNRRGWSLVGICSKAARARDREPRGATVYVPLRFICRVGGLDQCSLRWNVKNDVVVIAADGLWAEQLSARNNVRARRSKSIKRTRGQTRDDNLLSVRGYLSGQRNCV